MYAFSAKLGIRNARKGPQVVVIEPWARDYTLLPNENLEIIAFADVAMPWFNVMEADATTEVYCEDTADFKVFQGDRELACGHQRHALKPSFGGRVPVGLEGAEGAAACEE